MKVPFETFKAELLTAPCRTDRLTGRQLKRKVKYIFFSDQLLLLKTNKSTRRWILVSVRGCVSAFMGLSFAEITTPLFPDSYRCFKPMGLLPKSCVSQSRKKKVHVLAEQKSKTWWLWDLKASRLTGFSFLCCCAGFESRNLVFSKGWI